MHSGLKHTEIWKTNHYKATRLTYMKLKQVCAFLAFKERNAVVILRY